MNSCFENEEGEVLFVERQTSDGLFGRKGMGEIHKCFCSIYGSVSTNSGEPIVTDSVGIEIILYHHPFEEQKAFAEEVVLGELLWGVVAAVVELFAHYEQPCHQVVEMVSEVDYQIDHP